MRSAHHTRVMHSGEWYQRTSKGTRYNKIPSLEGIFSAVPGILLYDNLCAAGSLAGEAAGFDLFETNDAVFFGMDGKVAAHVCTRTCLLGFANLTDQYFARANLLAAKALDAKSLSRTVVDVFTRSTCFNF